jgi:hypothetical protein
MDQWRQQAQTKAVLHKRAAQFYQRCRVGFNIVSIIVGAIASLVGTIYSSKTVTPSSAFIFMTVAHWLLTVLATVSHAFDFARKEQKHYVCSQKYRNLCNDIQLTILEPQEGGQVKIESELSSINLQEPELPMIMGRVVNIV